MSDSSYPTVGYVLAAEDSVWLPILTRMSSGDLQALWLELRSACRHPMMAGNAAARFMAGERLQDIAGEFSRRFSGIARDYGLSV